MYSIILHNELRRDWTHDHIMTSLSDATQFHSKMVVKLEAIIGRNNVVTISLVL